MTIAPDRNPLMPALLLAGLLFTATAARAEQGPEHTLAEAKVSTEKLTELLTALAAVDNAEPPGPAAVADKGSSLPRKTVAEGPSSADVPASNAHVDPSAMQRRFERILDGIRSGGDPSVRTELERFVVDWPQHAQARYHLARGLIEDGDAARARSLLDPLKSQARDDWQPWFWSATAALILGDHDAARADLEHALSRAGDQSVVWVQEAVLEQELGNHAGAVQLLEVARRQHPDDAQVYLNLAYSYERLGDRQRALVAYRDYLTAPQSSNASLRARVLRRISEIVSAS